MIFLHKESLFKKKKNYIMDGNTNILWNLYFVVTLSEICSSLYNEITLFTEIDI